MLPDLLILSKSVLVFHLIWSILGSPRDPPIFLTHTLIGNQLHNPWILAKLINVLREKTVKRIIKFH